MNKLKHTLFNDKSWGSEIVWASTDSYEAKTIEINKNCKTQLVVYSKIEKSIVVIKGSLYLYYGDSDDIKMYKLPLGWSWHIDMGKVHGYRSIGGPVSIIEVSNKCKDKGTLISEEEKIISNVRVK